MEWKIILKYRIIMPFSVGCKDKADATLAFQQTGPKSDDIFILQTAILNVKTFFPSLAPSAWNRNHPQLRQMATHRQGQEPPRVA
jgi:hypothetical protein